MALRRRQALKAIGSIGGLSLIGTSAGTATGGGSTLRVGGWRRVQSLRPFVARLVAGSNMRLFILNAIFDGGIDFHPETAEPVNWAFSDWEVVDEEEGEVVATLRRDLKFSDGVKLTAEDVVTTMRLENRYGRDKQIPDDVEATGKYEVTYREIPDPPEQFLESGIVAAHIWQPLLDAGEADDYEPTDHGGPIGTGPFELESAAFELSGHRHTQEFALRARHEYPIPRDRDFLNNKGPFINRVVVKTYSDQDDLTAALRDGEIDLGLEVPPSDRPQFDAENVHLGDEAGWSHITYNLRRVPLDDKPFRQALATVFDHGLMAEVDNGVWVPGDVPMPAGYSYYRPYQPGEGPLDRYQRPETGSGDLDIAAIRTTLKEADGVHDYTFGPVINDDIVTGDREIRVDGQLLTTAHAPSADGGEPDEGGPGPLVFLRNADQYQPGIAQAWNQWVEDLQEVGIPIIAEITPFDEQVHEAYIDEDFDMFEMGWTNIPPEGSHLHDQFHSDNADIPDADDNGVRFNAGGYSGADDLLEDADTTYEVADRLPKLGDALLQIYEDQPMLVVGHRRTIQVLEGNWSGWMNGFGRFSDQYPLLNIQPGNPNR